MGIGDKFLDNTYKPATLVDPASKIEMPFFGGKIIKCPVKFTEDPIEFIEGSEFMNLKLRDIQRNIVEDLFLTPDDNGKNKYTEATVICGMRCHGLGTPILMSDGTVKKIENIVVGDQIMGPDSKPRNVLEVHTGKSELFLVHQQSAMNYTVNEAHNLSFIQENDELPEGFEQVLDISVKLYMALSNSIKSKLKGYRADFILDRKLSDVTITSIGRGQFYGVTIDGDHKYCLKDGTVTNNSGKSAVSALVSSYLTQFLIQKDDPATELKQMAGQQISLEFIANSEEQSMRTAYATYASTIMNNVWWKKYVAYLIEREDSGEGSKSLFLNRTKSIWFKEKNVVAWSLHSNSSSLAGMTSIMVVFDELSRFNVSDSEIQGESESASAQAVYYTAARSVTSLKPHSRIMTITSPMYETDFGMQLFYMAGTVRCKNNQREIDILRKKYRPKISYNNKMVGYHYSTFEMAPKHVDVDGDEQGFGENDDEFVTIKNQNPAAFRRDYLAIPPGSMNPFFEFPERIDLCVSQRPNTFMFTDKIIEDRVMCDGNLEIRQYMAKDLLVDATDKIKRYFLCADQGEKKDNFVLAMGHIEEYKIDDNNKVPYRVYIDFVEAWMPDPLNQVTVSFSNVEDIILQLSKNFNIIIATFDQWQSVNSIQNLFSAGIKTERLEISTKMYEELKRIIYSGYIDIPHNDLLLNELRQLNLVRGIKVDHLPSGCFTGDTRVKTLDGKNWTMAELAEKGCGNEFWVYACTSTGDIVPAKACNAHITKEVTELREITLDNDEVIRCTPEHLFMLKDGTYKQAKDLTEDVSLMPCYVEERIWKYKKGGQGKYNYIFINDKFIPVHSWVSSYMGFGVRNYKEVIHHNNINSKDNRPENLERLSRDEHARRHMLINAKAFTPETVKKRAATCKQLYIDHPEMREIQRQQAIKNMTPELREKMIEGSRKYFKEHGLSGELLAYVRSDIGRKVSSDNIKKVTPEQLSENGNKLNNGYWKTSEGKERRQELAGTQLVDARKIRMDKEDSDALSKLKDTIEDKYLLDYAHISYLVKGSIKAWERRKPDIDFVSNIKPLIGMKLEDALKLTKLPKQAFMVYLKKYNMWEEFKCYNHKVKSVKIVTLEKPISVYDITVPGYENFALGASVIVHNSKDSSDSVARVCWSVLNDYISEAAQGTSMLPKAVYMPTIRSVREESMQRDQQALYGNNNPYAGGSSIFGPAGGKGTFITGNVNSNGYFGKNKR